MLRQDMARALNTGKNGESKNGGSPKCSCNDTSTKCSTRGSLPEVKEQGGKFVSVQNTSYGKGSPSKLICRIKETECYRDSVFVSIKSNRRRRDTLRENRGGGGYQERNKIQTKKISCHSITTTRPHAGEKSYGRR